MGCYTKDIMEKRDGAFVFKKKDLEIDLEDGTQYVVNPEKDVCLYKIPYRPNGDGEEFYVHNTKNHGRQFYRLHFRKRDKKNKTSIVFETNVLLSSKLHLS
jgi:hypothetical protein